MLSKTLICSIFLALTAFECVKPQAVDEVVQAAEGAVVDKEESCVEFAPLGEPNEFTASTTGVKLAVRRWIPPDEVKSVVVVHHGGAGWHSGYFDIFGQSLQKRGIAVIAYDQVGSGYSEGMAGGLRQYVDSMETLSSDSTRMIQEARAKYPGKKTFALGESFGCMVLLHQILTEQKKGDEGLLADGYVFSGPVVKVLPEMLPPTPVIAVVKLLARFFPMLTMPGTDFFSTFDLAFGDQRWAKAGRADPFIQEAAATPPKLGMAASILSNMMTINESLGDIQVPFKIFTGENEGRVDVTAIKKLAEEATSEDKSIEIVPKGYHQLFQDMPDVTESVCEGIASWILERS